MVKLILYRTDTDNPYHNLAIEDFFIEYSSMLQEDVCILYFWQNSDTVVIGRHQDAVQECCLDKMKQSKIFLARRKTGGGAVFHDKNNLNFSFVIPKKLFDKKKSMELIQNAFKKIGLNAEISGRNDILIGGKKFSGNAYLNTKDVTLHHGTILIDTDVKKMQNVLNVDSIKLKSKGIRSVKSRVMNLKELDFSISVKKIENSIIKEFEMYYKGQATPFIFDEREKQITLQKEQFYSDEKWLFGKFTEWSSSVSGRLSFGFCTIKELDLPNKAKLFKLYSDSLDTEFIEQANGFLNGFCSKKDFPRENQCYLEELLCLCQKIL